MTAPYYDDGQVQLFLGDCREVTEWLAADVLVTDPPYGVNYAAKRNGIGRRSRGAERIYIPGDEDFSTSQAAIRLWGARPIACCANHGSLAVTHASVGQFLSRVRVMIWHKSNVNGGTPGNPWLADVEFVVCGVTEWPGRSCSALVSASRSTGNPAWTTNPNAYLHPTQKPIALMEAVVDAMPPGVIADPFAGSGSTLVAARNLGRKAVGVEIEERCCEITAKRLAQDCLPLGAG